MAFGGPYKINPSHSCVKTLKKEGCAFTSAELFDVLKAQLNHLAVPGNLFSVDAEPVPATMHDKDPQTLFVKYTSLYPEHGYIADEVNGEFGVRSLKEPYSAVTIQSICQKHFPNAAYGEAPFEVAAVELQKTLLEKAFLLHEKFALANPDKIKVERLSRHLYDLVRIMNTKAWLRAVKDRTFYTTRLEHRKSYTRLTGVDYDTLQYPTISFIPPESLVEMFRQDYKVLQSAMVYGEAPDFNTMKEQLKILTGRFRMINEYHLLEDVIERASKQIGAGTVTKLKGQRSVRLCHT